MGKSFRKLVFVLWSREKILKFVTKKGTTFSRNMSLKFLKEYGASNILVYKNYDGLKLWWLNEDTRENFKLCMKLEGGEIEEKEMRSYVLNRWKDVARNDSNARMSEV